MPELSRFQTLDEKVSDISCILRSGLVDSRLYGKYIRLILTEQKSLRGLDEDSLRCVYHYQSSIKRNADREAKTVEGHVVPVNIIAGILSSYALEGEDCEIEYRVKEVLERLLWVVFITEDENKRLTEFGLKSTMPIGWDWKSDSPFVRYEIAGIDVVWNE